MALAKLGLHEVILCPGSRNAPIAVSFNRHQGFHCASIRDERSAGFIALGKSIELREPVAIVCTSGSAALNFAPAIAEAYYQRIPLIVITADRPKEWTDQGDGQTINQTDIYHNFIRGSYELDGDAATESSVWHNRRCLSDGWNIATTTNRGPVHFNVPLHEPLYGTATVMKTDTRIFTGSKIERSIADETLLYLSKQFSSCSKVMILAGQYPADEAFQKELSQMAAFDNVIVLTESTSNVHDRHFIEHIDRCITGMGDKEATLFLPELLITVGGAVVSKRIKALLRRHRPVYHWNIHPFDAGMDTYQSLTSAIHMDAPVFFSQLRRRVKNVRSKYSAIWQQKRDELVPLHEAYCKKCAYSDLKVFDKIYKALPKNIFLHLANSSPIRYAQLFDNLTVKESWCNRGASGIDGCVSTAVGAAAASPDKQFLLITGDVAFHYDKNGLWNNESVNNLKIIVINNGGGGIFRIISGPGKVDELEKYFETTMSTDAEKLAQHYKWNYLAARDEPALDRTLKQLFSAAAGKCILEIFTNAQNNPKVLEGYWKFLKEKSGV